MNCFKISEKNFPESGMSSITDAEREKHIFTATQK